MTPEAIKAEAIVASCRGYANAIGAALQVNRALWSAGAAGQAEGKAPRKKSSIYRYVSETGLRAAFLRSVREGGLSDTSDPDSLLTQFLARLQQAGLCGPEVEDSRRFDLDVFQPLRLVRETLGGLRPDHDLRYFVSRSLRSHYRCVLSPDTALTFQTLAETTNVLASERQAEVTGTAPYWDYEGQFVPALVRALEPHSGRLADPRGRVELFVECCRLVNYLQASERPGCVVLRKAVVDAEYLISKLFGLMTGIPGFDELFGGGGLLLVDKIVPRESSPFDDGRLGGRTGLIRGVFGTGKSLLAAQLTVEVARKGGAALVILLEQSAEEYLYALRSMRILPDERTMLVATDTFEATAHLKAGDDGRGLIIILRTNKGPFENFKEALVTNAVRLNPFPLRLVCVDPINSIHIEDGLHGPALRSEMLKLVEDLKGVGTNVLFVAEENTGQHGTGLFEENLADTVIRLSVQKRHDYAQRYFEITKSRLQREQRGEHPFSITPGVGVSIFPSSAAVSVRVQPRKILAPNDPTSFGFPALDAILGKRSIKRGDVIVLNGPAGSFKSEVGMLFLLGSDDSPPLQFGLDDVDPGGGSNWNRRRRRRPISLIVAVRDSEPAIRHKLAHVRRLRTRQPNSLTRRMEAIQICTLRHGHVQPGYIMARLEEQFLHAALRGATIDRVLIDNVGHWELSCPFIREDATFGDMLVEWLRRQRVTSVLVCGDVPPEYQSAVQQSIINDADCLIQFNRFEFRDVGRVLFQVQKTRDQVHRRESFELTFGPKALEIKPSSSLLRVRPSGEVEQVKIRLFLHAESEMQADYNEMFRGALQAVLARDTYLVSQDHVYLTRAMGLGAFSAVDELQVLQLDEFQLGGNVLDKASRSSSLHTFSYDLWDGTSLDDIIPRLRQSVSHKGGLWAFPFYENISLLAYKFRDLPEEATTSWRRMMEECARWEENHPQADRLFFEFPRVTSENYNCLFMEILLSLEGHVGPPDRCDLRTLLNRPCVVEAGVIYRRLCSRAYFATGCDDLTRRRTEIGTRPIGVDPEAVVWRHWYSTLNQMMLGLNPKARRNIRVTTLPGSASIAGEWFLAVPIYSAAPDVGLEIIKLMTQPEAELDRLRCGVGLPTRSSFYEGRGFEQSADSGISPYFSLPMAQLRKLVNGAFQRSNYDCYADFSNVLAYHLQKIIEIPDGTDADIEREIQHKLDGLRMRLDMVHPDRDCAKCKLRRPAEAHGGERLGEQK